MGWVGPSKWGDLGWTFRDWGWVLVIGVGFGDDWDGFLVTVSGLTAWGWVLVNRGGSLVMTGVGLLAIGGGS